ncbi:hypothetical protein [Paenarthrobacter nicotinovorans]|uniref:hypothetical protein n=1 Tax=Paenarthrobacter nicotinovorans TaxID=29320 RepID=UPI003D66F0EA
MNLSVALSSHQLERVRAAAAVLLAEPSHSPRIDEIPEFDELLQQAAIAMGNKASVLSAAIAELPASPTSEDLSAYAEKDPESFEALALLAVGAYFMSPAVLDALGRPAGARRPASREQVVDELSTGLLDPVFERGCPVRSLDEVNNGVHAV